MRILPNWLRKLAQRTRWLWMLPITMTFLSGILWVVGTFELHRYPGAIDVVPFPYVMLGVIDYPAFAATRFLPSLIVRILDMRVGLEALPAVFLQWVLVGLVVDYSLNRRRFLGSRSLRDQRLTTNN